MGCCHSHSKVSNDDSPKNKSDLRRGSTTKIEMNIDNQNENTKNELDIDHKNQNETIIISTPNDKKKIDNAFTIQNESEEEEIPSLTLDSDSDEKSSSKDSTISEISDSSYSSYEDGDHGLVISKVYGYKYVKKLGKGAFSAVLEMKKGGKSYAIKVCDMSKEKYKFFKYTSQTNVKNNRSVKKPNSSTTVDPKEEVAIMKRFSHPYVIKFYDFYEDDVEKKIYIVMELLSGGNIGRCGTLSQKKLAFAQSVSALQYIHFQRIAHRDIKVDNILRAADGSIRIADFGVSKFIPEGSNKIPSEMIGTPAYSAPEVFGESSYDPFAADVWSLGVTLYYILFGRLPFIAEKLSEIQRKVSVEDVRFPDGTDKNVMDLIKKMLKKNSVKRIKLNDIWDHPWMDGMKEAVVKPNFILDDTQNQIYKFITPSQRKSSISRIPNKPLK